MLAHDLTKEYKRVTESGISPGLLGAFAAAVATCYSGAVALGKRNATDFPLDDDSLIVITVEPGQAPQFSIVERIHADMGEVTMMTVESKGK